MAEWARCHLSPEGRVYSDGLACFAGVRDAGCGHEPTIVGRRKPDEIPALHWVNTVLGNLKNTLRGAYHAFRFRKYGHRYLGAFAYRFNRRFDLKSLPIRLIVAAFSIAPLPLRAARLAVVHC